MVQYTWVMILRIIIDADACPVTKATISEAKKRGIAVICVCDTSHMISDEYAEVRTVDKGSGSADLAVVNLCQNGDIVITQDYGVASMALAKKALCMNQNGLYYTENNIDSLMAFRHIASEERRKSAKSHLKGPKKRTRDDDERFISALIGLLDK